MSLPSSNTNQKNSCIGPRLRC